jgi:hypothetical protein
MNPDSAVGAAKLILESIETAARLRGHRVQRVAVSVAAEGIFGVLAGLWVEVLLFLVISHWVASWLAALIMLALNAAAAGIVGMTKRRAKSRFQADMGKVRELRRSAREAIRGVEAPAAAAGAFIGGALMARAIRKKSRPRLVQRRSG